MITSQQPIGIFDSGIGGLTVAHAVAQALPFEDIIYIGDTAHLPYGDKSADTIQQYVRTIVDILLAKQCKLILIACNSATAAAYEYLKEYLADRAHLLGVIEPVVDYLAAYHQDRVIGLIGTKQTVNSCAFQKKLQAKIPDLHFVALATPLLVPVIEEGFHANTVIVDAVLTAYLSHSLLANIETLVLGCTHYPIIKSRLAAYYGDRVTLIDAAEISAQALKQQLSRLHLLNPQRNTPQHEFYVSDLTPAFSDQAIGFFGEAIQLQLL